MTSTVWRTLLTAIALGVCLSCTPPEGDQAATTSADAGGNGQTRTKPGESRTLPAMAVADVDRTYREVFRDGKWITVSEDPLVLATLAGDVDRIKAVIAEGADLAGREGQMSVYYAIRRDRIDIVKLLVAEGASPEYIAHGESRHSLLYDAILGQDFDLARYVMDHGADLDAVVDRGYEDANCPLKLAIYRGHTDFALKLIERGASAEPGGRETPLLYAVRVADEAVAEALIAKGADLNAVGALGTPLQVAAIGGAGSPNDEASQAMVDLLLSSGAEVDAFSAAALGMTEEVRWHLAEDPSLIDDYCPRAGMTLPLWAALSDEPATITLLAEAGAELNDGIITLGTPLGLAAYHGHTQTMQALLDHGAKIDMYEWGSALIAAANGGQIEAAKLLLANGADVNKATDSGYTALHAAAEAGHPDMVELFIARGADVNVATDDGDTPLSLARDGEFDDVVRLLLSHGADEPAGTRDP